MATQATQRAIAKRKREIEAQIGRPKSVEEALDILGAKGSSSRVDTIAVMELLKEEEYGKKEETKW